MLARVMCLVVAAGAVLLAFNTQEKRGKDLFMRRCSGCHALDLNKEGPRLRNVYGRKAASVPDFSYSDALKKLELRWDEASLGRWLTDPDSMAPDTDMGFRLTEAEERNALIAYLKSLNLKDTGSR